MPLKEHINKTFKLDPAPTPIFKMILSALATTIPLLVGYILNQQFVSMIAALMGLLLYLNDHFGVLPIRLKHLFATYLFMGIGFSVGAFCAGNNTLIVIILFILSFVVGKSKDHGPELEKVMLFVTLQFLTGSSDGVFLKELRELAVYGNLAFINYIFWAIVIFQITKHQVSPMTSKRETIKKIITYNKGLKFPLICAIFSCTCFIAAQMLEFSHPYWIVGTYLIVILPDSYQSIYKSSQRLSGTIIGVVLASVILTFVHDARLLLGFAIIFSFLLPQGISKNYWVGNVYIAALILIFLELGVPNSTSANQLGFWRIVDIAIGSAIGVFAAIWIKPELIKDLISSFRTKSL